MGKRSPAPPPAPDYAALAKQQGVENIEAAKTQAILSNPNIITPYGQQRVVFNFANQGMPSTGSGMAPGGSTADNFYREMIAGGLSPEAASAETTRRYGAAAGSTVAGAYEGTYPNIGAGVAGGAGAGTGGAGSLAYLQPTIIQTVSPTAQRAIEEQERAQAALSGAAAGAAQQLGSLGIATAFRPDNIPGLRYDLQTGQARIPGVHTVEGVIPQRPEYERPGYELLGGLAATPGAEGYQPQIRPYGVEAMPGQLGAGQMAFGGPIAAQLFALNTQGIGEAGRGAAAPMLQGFQYGGPGVTQMPFEREYGLAQGGPAAPTLQGPSMGGVGGVGQGVGVGQFGMAGGGAPVGLFGLAQGGPQAAQLQGLNLAGVGGVAGGMTGREFGMAGGGPGGVHFQGLDTSGLMGI